MYHGHMHHGQLSNQDITCNIPYVQHTISPQTKLHHLHKFQTKISHALASFKPKLHTISPQKTLHHFIQTSQNCKSISPQKLHHLHTFQKDITDIMNLFKVYTTYINQNINALHFKISTAHQPNPECYCTS
jgi:hypothetical protein